MTDDSKEPLEDLRPPYETEKPKQWIVMRKDLKMRKGKMMSQAAHGVLKVFVDRMTHEVDQGVDWDGTVLAEDHIYTMQVDGVTHAWLQGKFTKICLGVSSEEELLEVYTKAKAENLPCVLITDSGLTEFHGKPTNTCVVIGPTFPYKTEAILGHLKPL